MVLDDRVFSSPQDHVSKRNDPSSYSLVNDNDAGNYMLIFETA